MTDLTIPTVFASAGVLVAVSLIALLIARRERRCAAHEATDFDSSASLRPGVTALRGTAELAEGDDVAVRVEIDQVGEDRPPGKAGSTTHIWREVRRRVTAHAFILALEGGKRVRVLPDDRVMFVDKLDATRRESRKRRTRIAELSAGEQVHVRGVLDSAGEHAATPYRQAPELPTLRPPARGRMLISTDPMGERYLARARFHRRWALIFGLAVLAHTTLYSRFYDRLLFGRSGAALVTNLATYQTRDKSGPTTHYLLYATLPIEGPDANVTLQST